MATVTAFVRTTKKKTSMVNIRFRLRDGRGIQLFHKSNIEVNPSHWDNVRQEIKAKVIVDPEVRLRTNRQVAERKNLILEIYNSEDNKDRPTSEWFESEIDKRIHSHKYSVKAQPFFETFDDFLQKRKMTDVLRNNFRVVYRALRRYELYKRIITGTFVLDFQSITADTLRDIELFMIEEYKFHEEYPEIYAAVPESRKPLPRGQNTINAIFKKLRTFCLWAQKNGKSNNNPFENFSIEESVYGTPYYITIEERNRLYGINLSRHPQLAVQRDIFVFQCLIGCRVGDLYKMTRANVINGAIEYVPRKTKEGRPVTVRVPLNSIAAEILAKYPDAGGKLFPFVSEQKYNIAIKRIFLAARLCRPVTVINPTTREPEIRPLNEIASSHLARRCFVGNLYKQVKDPNLVGALSGHKEGSRAFARYREIDEQMKKDLVKLLEK